MSYLSGNQIYILNKNASAARHSAKTIEDIPFMLFPTTLTHPSKSFVPSYGGRYLKPT